MTPAACLERMTAEMRVTVARFWPDIDAASLDHLQVVRLHNEIGREREAAIVEMGRRA